VQGKLHRAFSVFIARKNHGKIELLLQQRNVMKYHSGGLWSNACCGHPRPGESVIAGAKRRLREEMGIDVELKDIGSFCYRAQLDANMIEHELDHVLIGEFCGQTIVPDADEVQNYKWESLPWVQQELRYSPYKYSTWLAPALMLASNDLYRYA
jgi:isopentenyl-diphosphate delta-isomerase